MQLFCWSLKCPHRTLLSTHPPSVCPTTSTVLRQCHSSRFSLSCMLILDRGSRAPSWNLVWSIAHYISLTRTLGRRKKRVEWWQNKHRARKMHQKLSDSSQYYKSGDGKMWMGRMQINFFASRLSNGLFGSFEKQLVICRHGLNLFADMPIKV